ncbi:nitrogen fixation protein NifM [Marichromatium bheemlicum]|uniref:peptidylprolyl isomerase n=1 Tax=Marichromatium bheemlicum TaxID=365339 RepID=A0ABX1IAA1_9GAMM|nr:nitrogen fixation protein NifM [Marichromatium bheemlicum]NKN34141.1 nitrogen fixation protein NifM [Marichromatium bheemlicum]
MKACIDPYHLIRASASRFRCAPTRLDPTQRAEAERLAERSQQLEALVLATPEAATTQISAGQIDTGLTELRQRYQDERAFAAALSDSGLDVAALRRALERELRFDAVLRRIGAQASAPGEDALLTFYQRHRDRFAQPERREARHLLITINPDYAENRPEAAHTRIAALAERLAADPAAFGALARRHSECPTALAAGRLGILRRGQLYPALDAALFALAPGAISAVLESPLGLHLLRCEHVYPGQTLPFEAVRERLRAQLGEQAARAHQRDWINALRGRMAVT